MTRFSRIRRRPDHWVSSHDRARVRAAERLDGPLGLSEATWLDAHLADCTECAAIAAAYDADRQSLQAMRTAPPEPPRDLWARTAAAIEHESAARHGSSRRAARDRRVPLGALSGLAVIAVVVGVSTMSSGTFFFGGRNPQPEAAMGDLASTAPTTATDTQTTGGAAAQVEPTPIAVAPGRVRWVDLDSQDGSLALNAADIDEVCPADLDSGCATLADSDRERLSLDAAPETIFAAPDDAQAIVVSRDAAGKQQLLVVDLPAVDEVTAAASADPLATAAAESAPPSTAPTVPPSDEPAASAPPTESAQPSASAPPEVTPSVEPSPSPEVVPSATPEATLAASLAIASDIEIIGESAAFSADGAWFAFTARAAGDATGSDVYLWKVGEDVAQPLTTDGTSSFASWDGDRVVISRPGGTDTSGEAVEQSTTTSLTIDPATGTETDATTSWRPAVDPSGSHAVAWSGTILADEDGAFGPDEGTLELIDWPPAAGDASAQTVVEGAIGDFDVRWDETGEWFAVWTADPTDTGLGRLSLFRVDEDGQLVRPKDAPAAVPALPGFSIGDGRLAWATPPGQGGEGSRVQIVAWAGDGVGRVESAPGEDLVVIR